MPLVGQFELSPAIIDVVKWLAALDKVSFGSLKSALSATKLTFSVEELAQQVSQKSPALELEQIEGILRTLMSVYFAHGDYKLDWDELLNSFRESLDDELPEQELDIVMQRVGELLQSSDSIQLISKAMNVYSEHDKVFSASRILTDIRPIFRDDEKRMSLGAAAIVHSLKLQYRQGRHVNDVYIALDDDDLNALAKDIDRAKQKSEQINELLKSTNLPFIATSASPESKE